MKVKYICKNCGSDSVGRDAFVDWNYEAQQWELANFINENGFCFQCSDETYLVEVVETEENHNDTQ